MDRIAIDRRIDFLLSEAASSDPIYDQSVRMTRGSFRIGSHAGKTFRRAGSRRLLYI
jgi:hypothetical protein